MVITGFKIYIYIYIVTHPQLVYLSHSEADIKYSLIFSSVTRNGKTYKSYQNTVWKLLFIKPFPALEKVNTMKGLHLDFKQKSFSVPPLTHCLERSNVVKRKNVLKSYKSNTTLLLFFYKSKIWKLIILFNIVSSCSLLFIFFS